MTYELITRPEAKKVSGWKADSSWHRAVKNGLLPSAIYIASNSARYDKAEIEAVTAARIAGYNNLEINN